MRYDPFQQEAIDEINQGHSVIVAAPTGAGKTAIAEHVIESCLRRREKVIYTAPIKALSNQKFRDFQEGYPDQVGILTGDVNINSNAPTLIMTTEIFRNKIIEEHSSLADYSWIIFDEIHYIDDRDRGSVWEESMIFLPDHMNILGLSATIPNVDELAQWLQHIHRRPVKVIKENNRPVPLHFRFQCRNQILESLKEVERVGYRNGDDRRLRLPHGIRNPREMDTNKPADLFEHLKAKNLYPCIYFVFGRRRAEQLAKELGDQNFLTPQEQQKITALYDELSRKFDINKEASSYELRPLIERGIAYHHAGMLPTVKEVVERLFTSRLIKVIFTTETFALGINMPARTVIFDEMRKFDGFNFGVMKTRDFYQMAGRAGRRSIDTEGFVYLRINPYDVSPPELQQVLFGEPERVNSRFNAAYATVLNLYQTHKEKLYDLYPFSFHHFQVRKQAKKQAVEMMRNKVRLLKETGHIRKNQITPKGHFARRVYGYELIMAEFFDRGYLEKMSEVDLANFCLAAVFEPRKGLSKPKLGPHTKNLQKLANDIIFPLMHMERQMNIVPLSKPCFFHLAPALEGWLKGETFDEILEKTGVDEGEIVRYFRMTIQMMREILEAPVSDDLRRKLYSAIQKINRDVIDAEKQLRT